jgi:hypothetical protein
MISSRVMHVTLEVLNKLPHILARTNPGVSAKPHETDCHYLSFESSQDSKRNMSTGKCAPSCMARCEKFYPYGVRSTQMWPGHMK